MLISPSTAGLDDLQTPVQPSMDLLHRLPAELRNRIYELALSTEEYTEGKKTITIRQCSCFRFFNEEEPPWQEPALLRAAKWIRSEAK